MTLDQQSSVSKVQVFNPHHFLENRIDYDDHSRVFPCYFYFCLLNNLDGVHPSSLSIPCYVCVLLANLNHIRLSGFMNMVLIKSNSRSYFISIDLLEMSGSIDYMMHFCIVKMKAQTQFKVVLAISHKSVKCYSLIICVLYKYRSTRMCMTSSLTVQLST